MPTNEIQYNDKLRVGTDKLNAAIRQANKSEADSVAAVDTANEAKNQSQAAETKADSVQTQFNQVVVEGDSSPQASQASVGADGTTYGGNLKARLDAEHNKVTDLLAETEVKALLPLQRDFLAMQQVNSKDIGGHTYDVIGDRYLRFKVNLGGGDWIEHEVRKNPLDDFMKWTTSKLSAMVSDGIVSVQKENFDPANISGGSLLGSGNNFYVTAVNAQLTFDFTGTDLYFFHFTDNRGGVWRFEIDGVNVAELSTHINAVPTEDVNVSLAKRKVAEGLDNEPHTLVMTFLGADPNHVPSGGTARGWIRFNDGSSGSPSLNQETFEYTSVSQAQREERTVIFNSNKEFAFRAKVASASYDAQWMPEHNSIGTAFKGSTGYQSLFIDGEKTNMSTVASGQSFSEAKVIQRLDFKHPDDPVRLGFLLLITTVSSQGVFISGKMIWEREVLITAGYVNMLTLASGFSDVLVTSYGKEYDLKITDGSSEDINEKTPIGFIALNKNELPDYYIYMQNGSTLETLRLNESGRRGNEFGENLYFLQHRDANLQKLYPHTYSNHTAEAGETYFFEGRYGFGKLPGVASLLA